MVGFEGHGDFDSDDPYERYIAHQAAKGRSIPPPLDIDRDRLGDVDTDDGPPSLLDDLSSLANKYEGVGPNLSDRKRHHALLTEAAAEITRLRGALNRERSYRESQEGLPEGTLPRV